MNGECARPRRAAGVRRVARRTWALPGSWYAASCALQRAEELASEAAPACAIKTSCFISDFLRCDGLVSVNS
eukprot:6037440-Prymnesium_polylepis.1